MSNLKNDYNFCDVIIGTSARSDFTYHYKANSLIPGDIVKINFRGKEQLAIIDKINIRKPAFATKEAIKINEINLNRNENFKKFFDWLSIYYINNKALIFKSFLPSFIQKQLLSTRKRKIEEPDNINLLSNPMQASILSNKQNKIFETINNNLKSEKHETFLIHGITGSGKTHIYKNLAIECINKNKSVLCLVPEIALTNQLCIYFEEVFGDKFTLMHSGLTNAQRRKNWEKCHNSEAIFVLGLRSAIFAPLKKIGLIVIDEEHDSSYSQEETNLAYNGRDSAIMKAYLENATVVLGSATPSIESYYNAINKKYTLLNLNERFGESQLPLLRLIDLRKEGRPARGSSISPHLINAIASRLAIKEQVIILDNRRGFATSILCLDCGESVICKTCELPMTYHKNIQKLSCHYCESKIDVPKQCPKCNSNNIKELGFGIQKVVEDLEKAFPETAIARMDSDTIKKEKDIKDLLQDFRDGKTKILAGTQIVSKGFDFDNVTLVGIINSDRGLRLPDIKSSEKVFQSLTQTAGRSGRRKKRGEVILQTYNPKDEIISDAINQDFVAFYKKEILVREALELPPFTALILIKVLSKEEKLAKYTATCIKNSIIKIDEKSLITGPYVPPFAKIRGYYRYYIYIKSCKRGELHPLINKALKSPSISTSKKVKIIVTVDPSSLI